MPGARSIALIWLLVFCLVPAARAQSGAPASPVDALPPRAEPQETLDMRQILLRNGVRFCTFFVQEDSNAIQVRDVYGNTRSIPRSEIAQMHTGSRARRMCESHLVRAPTSATFANSSADPDIAPSARAGGKNEWVALGLSLAVPIGAGLVGASLLLQNHRDNIANATGGVLIIGALTVGPSAGHLYTGQFARVAAFSLLRTVALAAAGSGICPGGCEGTGIVPALGGVTWLVLTIADVVDAPLSAQRVNAKTGLTLAPMLLQERGRDLRPIVSTGLQLAVPF